jgi:hypothetical protein
LHPLCPPAPSIKSFDFPTRTHNKNDINSGRQRFYNISDEGVARQTHHSKTNYVLSTHSKQQRRKERNHALNVAAGGCVCERAIILSVDAMLTGRGQISALRWKNIIRPSRPSSQNTQEISANTRALLVPLTARAAL